MKGKDHVEVSVQKRISDRFALNTRLMIIVNIFKCYQQIINDNVFKTIIIGDIYLCTLLKIIAFKSLVDIWNICSLVK